jgi:hypothetical protein
MEKCILAEADSVVAQAIHDAGWDAADNYRKQQ